MSEKLDVAEARALLRFHEAEHQHQLHICMRTSAVNTISPSPSLVIHNFIVHYKAFPRAIFLVAQFRFCRLGCCSFPIVAPRPQLHLDLLISWRTTFCPEQEEPQNTIKSAKSTLKSSNIAVIVIRNSASTTTLCQHRVRARSKSLSTSRRSYSTDLG